MVKLKTVSGQVLSPFAYGCMQWGGAASWDDAQAMFDQCRAVGINHFDTANGYTDGQSETMLGKLAATQRDEIFVASKIGYIGGCTPGNLKAQFDVSLSRLNMDHIDLLYLHRFDPETPLETTFETIAEFQSNGLIRHIGVSNYAAWQVVKAQQIALSFGTRIDALQPMYSLVKRQAEVEILPMAQDQDITVFPYSPLGSGLLTGKYADNATGRLATDPRYNSRYAVDWMHDCAKSLRHYTEKIGTHSATLAVAWAAQGPFATSPIISARNSQQLESSLAALNFTLDDAAYETITAFSKTPAPATDRLEEH